ncbi:MAG: tetraacyldisaccharide 4'-kinase [Bdellovibrionaceae bacterium]|nr:tetraacyldisaccharide 4'-kinase [Pseudobdellovibrionaceae bacterium]
MRYARFSRFSNLLTFVFYLIRSLLDLLNPITYFAFFYRYCPRKLYRSVYPVVSVGNLVMGGSGKTPFVIWLAKALLDQGFKLAVFNRNYGGKAWFPKKFSDYYGFEDLKCFGDEACLYRSLLPSFVDVVSGPVKWRNVKFYDGLFSSMGSPMSSLRPIFLLDDGFQHHNLKKDFEIVLVNVERRFHLSVIPFGEGREHVSALRQADAVILTRANKLDANKLQSFQKFIQLFTKPNSLILHADFQENWPKLESFIKIIVITSFAHPQSFIKEVDNRYPGQIVATMMLRDHQVPSPRTIKKIHRLLDQEQNSILLCTYKDWVKLQFFFSC